MGEHRSQLAPPYSLSKKIGEIIPFAIPTNYLWVENNLYFFMYSSKTYVF